MVKDQFFSPQLHSFNEIMEFGFQLFKIEDFFSSNPSSGIDPFKPHRIDFFTLLLLTEGKMSHEVDFIEYKMSEDDCLFISKEQIHKFDNSLSYKGYGIIFTEEFMLHHLSVSAFSKINFLYNCQLSPSLFKDCGDRDIFLTAIKRELSLNLGKIKADVVASMLTVFLLKAQSRANQVLKTDHGDYGLFMQFQKLVTTKYKQTRKAREYAILLDMTYKQLNLLCKSFTNKTAKEYTDNYVVLQAKRLLATSKFPVRQIAFECGFSEETNFLKFFKKIVGFTPAQFREMRP